MYVTHAWHNSIVVWLLGQSSFSSPCSMVIPVASNEWSSCFASKQSPASGETQLCNGEQARRLPPLARWSVEVRRPEVGPVLSRVQFLWLSPLRGSQSTLESVQFLKMTILNYYSYLFSSHWVSRKLLIVYVGRDQSAK